MTRPEQPRTEVIEGRRTTITELALRGLVSQVPGLRIEWPEGQDNPTIYRDEAALPVPALSELDEDLRGGPWWPEPPLEDEIGDRGGEVNLTNRAGDSLLLKAADVAKIIADLEAAIAHDRQPYPTAWAYEQACKARDEWKRKAEALPVPALDHPRTYSLVGSPHLFLVTDDESHMNIGYADQIGGPLVAYLGEDTPAEAALPVPAREHGIVPQSEDAWEAPVPALSDEGIEWLLARIEETRTSYNEVLARHPNDPILRELRWAIGHATLAAEVAANARAALTRGPTSPRCAPDRSSSASTSSTTRHHHGGDNEC